ncbi:thioesterase II family protein [Azorhizobium doebereinerae]|uniref:thioesterase II family protein n=1 Tax=Azorhizobium doebereinerae TaxID=281091 RepID=UPI0003FE2DD8|nr:alpha/beta fold hydrolase [Azorhizobium doebereinerae]
MNALPPAADATRWVRRQRAEGAPAVRLFCLPYGGGGASLFNGWRNHLPPGTEVCAIQLPGRQDRIGEPAIDDLDAMVTQLEAAVAPLAGAPYALFGHSMGALLAFALAHRLRARGGPGPLHLFVSAFRAPHLPARLGPLGGLDDDAFLAELGRLGRISGMLEAAPDLTALLIPALRADVRLCEAWACPEGLPPLPLPITCFGGRDDDFVPPEDMAAWRRHTTGRFRHHTVPGDHFFIHDFAAHLAPLLAGDLGASLRAPSHWALRS